MDGEQYMTSVDWAREKAVEERAAWKRAREEEEREKNVKRLRQAHEDKMHAQGQGPSREPLILDGMSKYYCGMPRFP